MEVITTHPANAQQAKAFTEPTSLSYPGGYDKEASVKPAKEAAQTPADSTSTSGIVPTLQYVLLPICADQCG